jgi:hypothetical protein
MEIKRVSDHLIRLPLVFLRLGPNQRPSDKQSETSHYQYPLFVVFCLIISYLCIHPNAPNL